MEKLFESLSNTQLFILTGGVLFGVYYLIAYGIESARKVGEANARAKVDCQRLEVARQLADAGHVPEAVEQLLRTVDAVVDPLVGKSEHELAGLLAESLAAAGVEEDSIEGVMGLYWAADPPLKLATCQTVMKMAEEQADDVLLAAARGLLKGSPKKVPAETAAR